MLHGNASKIWLVDKRIKNGSDQTPLSLVYKECVVFHSSGNVYWQKVKDFGKIPGKKSTVYLDMETKTMEFYFQKQSKIYQIEEISDAVIKLIYLKGKPNQEELQLVPYPEF